jgi:hypothetical protein
MNRALVVISLKSTVFDEIKTDWGVFGVGEFVFVIIFSIRVIVEKVEEPDRAPKNEEPN